MRKFIIEEKTVEIQEVNIKKYYPIGKCFVKNNGTVTEIKGNIFVAEDGTVCDCDNCSNELGKLVDEEGITLSENVSFEGMTPLPGFIYNNRLYFLESIQES